MNYIDIKEKIFQEIERNKDELISLNDYLADNPEISGEEYESSKKIVQLLQKHGYKTEYPFAGIATAFRGVYGENNHKYKVAVLVEYDALPEIGHACGHCLSGAISVLAGLAMKDLQDELDTDIHIIGTPIEETDGAKCTMVEEGIFDQYDMAIMVHLFNANLIIPSFQALSSEMYEFRGKAAHASAAPWEGVNAFNAAQLMFHGIDMLRQHTTVDAQFHGIIRNGGEAPNIVPEYVTAEIYVRAEEKDYLLELIDRVDKCAEGGAIATGASWSKYPTAKLYANLKHNKTGGEVLEEVYDELGLVENGDRTKCFGSSDIGNVSFACPAFHPCLQVVDGDIAIHTREFAAAMKTERAHETLGIGARIIALQIAKVFSSEEKIKAMKEDFINDNL